MWQSVQDAGFLAVGLNQRLVKRLGAVVTAIGDLWIRALLVLGFTQATRTPLRPLFISSRTRRQR
jgi:hypothetical protein